MTLRLEREKSCEMKSEESTDLSQRQNHGDVRTEASKQAFWRIRASACYLLCFSGGI